MAFSFTVHGQPNEETAAKVLAAQLSDVVGQIGAEVPAGEPVAGSTTTVAKTDAEKKAAKAAKARAARAAKKVAVAKKKK